MRVEPKPSPREAVYQRALFWKGEYDTAVAELESLRADLAQARAELEEARGERDQARGHLAEAVILLCAARQALDTGEHLYPAWVQRTDVLLVAAPEARAQGEGGGAQ